MDDFDELRTMMDGCAAHERELYRYIAMRDALGDWPELKAKLAPHIEVEPV